jgi:hypothetical protein
MSIRRADARPDRSCPREERPAMTRPGVCHAPARAGRRRPATRPMSPPRFVVRPDERWPTGLTGLVWHPEADVLGYPVSWEEGYAAVRAMNRAAACGRTDWRMPNRRELRSLLWHGAKNPALPPGILSPRSFWPLLDLHHLSPPARTRLVRALEGARVFYERKDRYCLCGPCAPVPGPAGHGPGPLFRRVGPGNPVAPAAARTARPVAACPGRTPASPRAACRRRSWTG